MSASFLSFTYNTPFFVVLAPSFPLRVSLDTFYDRHIKVYLFLAIFFLNNGVPKPKFVRNRLIFRTIFCYIPRPWDFSSGGMWQFRFFSWSVFFHQEGHILTS